ncbi:MAG TPA: hypothetical protein VJL59_09565 [Anaerolineales bacterium]|nr:hypothetical protein [Anaerolineales bacterium]
MVWGWVTIHWVSAKHALEAEVRLYDRLFLTPEPDSAPTGKDFTQSLWHRGVQLNAPACLNSPTFNLVLNTR